jgi:hypothetical protein
MNKEGLSIETFTEALHDEAIDGDPGGRVLASPGKGLPFADGERSRLVPLMSSIGG